MAEFPDGDSSVVAVAAANGRALWVGAITLAVLLAGLAALTLAVFQAADPFCWRGYEIEDGSCAWE